MNSTPTESVEVITPEPLYIVKTDWAHKSLEQMERRFRRETQNHKLRILHDEGLYRHLSFSGGNFYGFNIITWPGHLTISGEMGDYTFAREPDMLRDFFTSAYVNTDYWEQKVTSMDVHGRITEFSRERYKEILVRGFWSWHQKNTDKRRAREAWNWIRDDLLGDYSEVHDASTAVESLELLRSIHGVNLGYHEEGDFLEYSAQYLWSLHGVLWACQNYRRLRPVA